MANIKIEDKEREESIRKETENKRRRREIKRIK